MDDNFTGFGYEWKQNEPQAQPEARDLEGLERDAPELAPEQHVPEQFSPEDSLPPLEEQPLPRAQQPRPNPYQPYAMPPQPPYPSYAAQYPAAPQAIAAPQVPPRRKKTGLTIFLVMLLAVAMTGAGIVGGAAWRYMRGGTLNSFTSEAPTKADDTQLNLAATPGGDSSVPAVKGALSPVEIHQRLQNANVAVQLYSSRAVRQSGGESVVSEGSGIIIHEDSTGTYTYVVTCAHVISRDASVSVELEDGTRLDAEIVGSDTRTDVGLLRVKKTGLNGAIFGDSEKLKVGEPVYAIGNPGGIEFKGSFTNGIVSAIERPLGSSYTMLSIQHTAAINPGNSGGALVNAFGQVVGINSQKIVDARYEGMGFAIPSKVAKGVVDNLIARGYVPNRPKLGIRYLAASESRTGYIILRANDLPSGSLIIAKIDDDSVFTGTDVRPNDIITHVNGEPLHKPAVLLEAIENSKVGDTMKLTIARVNPQNYSVSSFEVSVKLIEDKGAGQAEPETRPWYYDQFGEDFFGW